ncbi:MAG TPA: nicotinate phosphoribosyltransferase [Symbiobacteriaceae bacterium]|nr:nicotinate phosphoribosyltransferase [Symbiobacteriaceae bacterium]
MLLPFGSLAGDEYALEMMRAYWLAGTHRQAVGVAAYFRKSPFQGSYAICLGTNQVAEYLAAFAFTEADLAYVATLGFEDGFVEHLRGLRFTGSLWVVEEGSLVFPNEPLVLLQGALEELTFFEARILNILNPQTLIGTKAARVVWAAGGDPVLEMGLRRAHGYDAGLWHSRACYIAGVEATSNLEAGRQFGIPVRGTMAHALVMMAQSELDGFRLWANAQLKLGRDPVFLVDTYDVLRSGVPHAIRVCQELGCALGGIRIDSGDLAYLARESRRLLDEAGFTGARIIASGDLDEYLIRDLRGPEQNAPIDLWGVGTQMIVAADQPSLGGVYKIIAVQEGQTWAPRIKLSENPAKITTPGLHRTLRFRERESGKFLADLLLGWDEPAPTGEFETFHPEHPWKRKRLQGFVTEEMLLPLIRDGHPLRDLSDWVAATARAKERCQAQLQALWPEYRRLTNPEPFPVNLSRPLWELKQRMIQAGRPTQ